MSEPANDSTKPDAASVESTEIASTKQPDTRPAALTVETLIPRLQSLEATESSMKIMSRESHEQTRQIREANATLKLVALGMLVISLAIFISVIYFIKNVLGLIAISFLIAYVWSPIVAIIERLGINRTLIVIVITLLILGGFGVLSTVAVSSIAGQVINISEDLRDQQERDKLVNNIAESLSHLPEFIRKPMVAYLEKWEEARKRREEARSAVEKIAEEGELSELDTATENEGTIELTIPEPEMPPGTIGQKQVLNLVTLIQDKIANYIEAESQQLLGAVGSSAKGAFSAFTTSIIVLFTTFFFLNGGPQMKKAFVQFVPNRFFEPTLVLVEELDQQLGSYLRSRLLETIALSILFAAGYWFLGLRFAIILGVIAGLANLIPYIGPFIGAIPAFLAVFLGSRFGIGESLLAVLGLTLAGQLIDNAIIFPLVVGKSVELGPVATIIVVLLGERLLGLLGLLMAVPIAAMTKLICQEFYTQFKGYTRSILHGN